MWKIFLASLTLSIFLPAQTSFNDADPVLRINELHLDLSGTGLSTNDCLVLYGNKKFHLERRVQQLPKQTNDLTIFETQLTPQQSESLEKIFSTDAIKKLPAYTPPVVPLSISTFDSFFIDTHWNGREQTAGYLDWPNKSNGGSPNNTPEQIQQDWRMTKANLEPLQTWIHDLEDSNLTPSHIEPDLCDPQHKS